VQVKLSPKDMLSTDLIAERKIDRAVLRDMHQETSRSFNTFSEAIIPEYTPVSNQGGIGSCVANAMCDGLEILQGLADPFSVQQLSRLSLYYWSRCKHRGQTQDDGTYIHSAAEQLQTMGVLLESDWPYDESKVNDPPPSHLAMAASDNRLSGAVPLKKRADVLDEVEALVRSGCPVVLSAQITRAGFQDPDPSAVLDAPEGEIWGGHAILCTGVRVLRSGLREFYIRNSWGASWGDHGHIWINTRYMERGIFGFVALTLRPGLVTL